MRFGGFYFTDTAAKTEGRINEQSFSDSLSTVLEIQPSWGSDKCTQKKTKKVDNL